MAVSGQRSLPSGGQWRADRLMLACLGLLAVAAAWFVVYAVHPVGPVALLWITTPFYGPLVAAIFWRTARHQALPAASRRFWRQLAWAALLVGFEQTTQAYLYSTRPETPASYFGPTSIVCNGLALVIVIYALLRLPFGRPGRGEMRRIVLDAGTVVVATGVFIWHFGTRQSVATADSGYVAFSLVLVVLALLGVFAVVKVLLSDFSVIDGRGLRLLATAMFIGALAPMVQPWITAIHPNLMIVQVSVPAVFVFAALSARRQPYAQPSAAPRSRARRRRAFSVLPYTAVAAVDGLLLWSVFDDRSDLPVVTVAAVALTLLVVVRQITAMRDNDRLLRQLDHGANHDALTGLPNRLLFRQRLDAALAAPVPRPVAVALVDLDDFKEVNDTLGHDVGDLLLVDVARRLAGAVRPSDTVARLGGDEFVLVLDDAGPTAADAVIARVVAALAPPVTAAGHELPIRASIGIADGRSGDDASTLLRHADIAMYVAKTLDGTAYVHYDPGMQAPGSQHADVAELRAALAESQLFLLYQPIVSLHDGRTVGAEALVRWAHPGRGTVGPDAFIPVAERSGLITDLDRWVMKTAVRQLARWDAELGSAAPAGLSVNVSGRTLRDSRFADEVTLLLAAHHIAAPRLTVEVTETVAVEAGPAVATLRRLRQAGVRISLDDFGTHYSTLRMLQDCPVDEIKLDRSFTQAETGDDGVPMAAAVIHLAQVLGLHAVAEGAETSDHAAQLAALGYTAAQGYYFARPLPPVEFAATLPAGDDRGHVMAA